MIKYILSLLIPLSVCYFFYVLILPNEQSFEESLIINSSQEIISDLLLDVKKENKLQPFIKEVKHIGNFNNTNYYEMIEQIEWTIFKKNITLFVSTREIFRNETMIELEFRVQAPLNTHVQSIFILKATHNNLTKLTQKFKINTAYIFSKFSFDTAKFAQNQLRNKLKEISENILNQITR
jgi:hypothetical protein